MMELDVSVRLKDSLSKPAGDAGKAIDRLGQRTERLVKRFERLAGGLSGLSGSLRGLAATATAADKAEASTGRLRGSFVETGLKARAAARDMNRFARSIDGVAKSAAKARSSIDGLQTAMKHSPSEGFVSGANSQLKTMINLQQQALQNMRSLNSGGGGGRGRRGLATGMGGGSGGHSSGPSIALEVPGLSSIARNTLAGAEDAENALTQLRMTGLTDRDVTRVKMLAQQVANENPLTNFAENLRGIVEARTALSGDLDGAMKLFPKASKYAAVFAHAGGATGDQVKAAKDAVYSALRAGELRNIANDPARMDQLMSGMMGASIASDGRITPKQWASNIQYARSAGLGLNDRFTNLALPFLMQELSNAGKGAHGGQAGNALMSAYSTIVQSRIRKQDVGEWIAAGQLAQGDVDKEGRVKPGAIKGTSQFMDDPLAFMRSLMENFHQRGITAQDDVLKHLSGMFGNRVAAGLMDLLALQDSRLSAFMDMERQAGAGDPGAVDRKFQMITAELGTSVTGLSHAFDRLKTTFVAPFIPTLTSAVRGLTSLTSASQNLLAKFFGMANDPNDPRGSGWSIAQIATFAGAGLWGAGSLITKAPGLATVAGQVGVGATAGPVAGFLARSTIKETVETFSKALNSTIGAGLMRTLGRGVLGSLVFESASWAIGKVIDRFRDNFASKERQFRADKFNQQNFFQKFGWFGGSSDPMDPRFAPPAGTPLDPSLDDRRPPSERRLGMLDTGATPSITLPSIAGRRARGGPVRGGSTYLVGEHGPELFTAGSSGGISTANVTRAMLNGGPDDEKTAKSVRYIGVKLASAVDEIAKSVDRLADRYNFDNDNADSSGGGGGGLGGGTSGGRRGFMARGGHFGGRRGFMAGGAHPADYGTPSKSLLDFIAKSEGTRGYNTSLGYGKFLPGHHEANLEGMTLNQILELGRYMRRQPGNPNSSALGRYQFTGQTIQDLMKRMGLKGDEKFDGKMQDALASKLIHDEGPRALRRWASLTGGKMQTALGLLRSGQIASQPSAPGAGGAMPNVAGGYSSPTQIKGMMKVGDQSFRFGSGGNHGAPSIPFGDYPITPDTVGAWGRAYGALGINNNAIYDKALGRMRQGIEIHAGHSASLVTSGCIAFEQAQFPKVKAAIKQMIARTGHAYLHVGKDGASISPEATIPPVVADHAKSRAKEHREHMAALEKANSVGPAMNVVNHISVNAHPHHDEKQIAAAVHRRFNEAARSQLTDGVYG